MPSPLAAAQRRLTAAQARKRRQDAGPPLDVDIDAASTVSAADQPEAQALARSVAGQRAVEMLEAR